MSKIDYTYFYKSEIPLMLPWPASCQWDIFISAYSSADRVSAVYKNVSALQKYWIIFPEYDYSPSEYPTDTYFACDLRNEADFIQAFWKNLPLDASSKRICIDITGFIRPYLLFLLRWLQQKCIKTVDFIYSEPTRYTKGEQTRFSDEVVVDVRQVIGYEGTHTHDTSKDILIIGSGYDHKLIAEVAEFKEEAKKIQLFGLPSLRADMYQENVLRAYQAEEAVGSQLIDESNCFFAPANDPFATASVLQEITLNLARKGHMTNLYLCPLATKPQLLGFALFYLWEGKSMPCSILFPFSLSYSRETTTGIARIWKYTAVFSES
ncbi:hypothetical protein [Fimbriiglobus ruber]|uniref:hypothetical protein n=1 Tax=Fimbriiglobus ruber TaxID=1908690 RepID=UPI00117A3FE4|nr:hypothetical protein [Fimbriiglobus ruber]